MFLLVGRRERPWRAFGIAFVMFAVHAAQEHVPCCPRESFQCLRLFAVFFDRSGISSLFVCLEHGNHCQVFVCSPERTSLNLSWDCFVLVRCTNKTSVPAEELRAQASGYPNGQIWDVSSSAPGCPIRIGFQIRTTALPKWARLLRSAGFVE